MSSLIKSAALGLARNPVRPFAVPVPARAPDQPSGEFLHQARIAELEAELASIAEELPAKLERAREEGSTAARKERSEAEAQALKALAEVLKQAHASWDERLSSWEGAACGIAKAALEQMFTAAGPRAEFVEAAIARQLERLDASMIVRIRVSGDDFAGDARLARKAKAVGARVALERDPALKSGGCVIDLKLGHVDVSPGAQWTRLAGLLDRLEREGLIP
jgi:type III secretion protein L